MRLGIAGLNIGSEEKIRIAHEIGYDFIESGLSAFASNTQAEVDEFADLLDEIGIPCISTNGMFPSHIKLIGKEADKSKIVDYLYEIFEKTKKLNTRVCVLGSSGARTVAADADIDACYDEFAQLCCETIAPITEKYGKVLAIEPLNYKECNIVNTVADSMRVVKACNKPSIKTLIDFYHVRFNGEDINTFVQYGDFIEHVHVASFLNNRLFPRPYDGENYKAFFDVLRAAKYKNGNISIEAGIIDSSIAAFKNAALSSFSMLKQF